MKTLVLLTVVIFACSSLLYFNVWQLKDRLWALAGNSKTIVVAYVAELVAMVDEFKMLDISSLVGAERAGRIIAIMGVIMFGLRLLTRKPATFKVDQ